MGSQRKKGHRIIEAGDRSGGSHQLVSEQVGNGATRASNWMTHQGPKSGPSLKVGLSWIAADDEEMEE